MKKPHVVVFFGGTSGSRDLSEETGYWMCQYIPRSKYNVTPVRITSDGKWQVPLGSLPSTGPVKRMLNQLWNAIPALPARAGLERLLSRPASAFLSVVRGPGGDDGATQSLGQTLSIPVVGSPASACIQTADKYLTSQVVEDIVGIPETYHFRADTPVEDILAETRDRVLPPVFVKPACEEGSVGVDEARSVDELGAAVHNARQRGDILIQRRPVGTELSVTLVQDETGHLRALPSVVIVPKKASFYDLLAKRKAGRVVLHPTEHADNPVITEATLIAGDIFEKLGCQDFATIDMVVGDEGIDLLEVNTVPTLSELTPLHYQLKAAGLHPAMLVDSFISRRLTQG